MNYKMLRVLLLLPMCLCFFQTGWSQNKAITGTVIDDRGNPVNGASVIVKGTAIGTATDPSGNFSLSVPSSATTLVISSVGFSNQEVNIANQTNVSIVLTSTTTDLSEVVVVGYGTARKKDVTGAVASISNDDFNKGVVTSPVQQIQGKVAGLVITQPGGDPNQNVIIRLRGQTSLTGGQTPLIVVDGVPLDDPNQIMNIPPGDIASYDILKDASAAAIYGSRGANGVIIINTKKGKAGRTQIDYTGFVATEAASNKLDMLTPDQYRAQLDPGSSYDKGGNTDWQEAITRRVTTTSHNLGISGGSNGFSYRGSASYINQPGIVINSGKEELGLRFNAQQKAMDDKLNIQMGIVNTVTNRKYADYNIFLYALNTPPTYPVYNPDGSYFGYYDFNLQNPVAQQMMQVNNGKEVLSLLYGTVNYELMKGLIIGATGSYSNSNYHSNFFQPSLPLGPGNTNVNNANQYSNNRYSKKGDLHLNYFKDIGDHTFNLTLVHEYNDYNYTEFRAAGQEFLIEENEANSLGNGNSSRNSISSYRDEYQLASFLERLAYNYKSKYYLTVSLRQDGSSKFGKNNRWGNFPSISGAWRISKEAFMQNAGWVNELKLSGGYGVTGNQDAIDPYRTLLLLSGSGRYYNPTTPTNAYPQSYTPSQNPNPDLKWEERHGTNIGLDFALFNNNLSGNINVFSDKTKNLLFTYSVPVPPNFVDNTLLNVGDLSNKGIELQLSTNIINKKDFTWSVGGQISFIKTEITNLSGTYNGIKVTTDKVRAGTAQGRGLSDNYISFLKVGYAPYVFYLPHYMGVDKDGNQLFADSAGNAVHDATQAQFNYYSPVPDFTYGINTTLTYKNWGLNLFLRGVSGQKIFNNTALIMEDIGRLPSNNILQDGLTSGIKDKTPVASDHWLQNASYLRLDNATISYTFKNLGSGIESLRLYVSGNNLFCLTPYKGLDPEINTADIHPNQAYIDYTNGGVGYYPKPRSFAFGLNVSFK